MSKTLMETSQLPRVAIVGRPNVGKSTLFNRLLRRRRAITLDVPGVTRDAVGETVDWDGRQVRLVDTGGLGGESDIVLASQVHEHTLKVISASDLLIVLLDARSGLNPLDRETVELVMASGKPAVFVANKADGSAQHDSLSEFCELGIDPPLGVSAEHGIGITELKMAVSQLLQDAEDRASSDGNEDAESEVASDTSVGLDSEGAGTAQDASTGSASSTGPIVSQGTTAYGAYGSGPRPCRVALVGRPNVGKSSLLNLLAGSELSLVDENPGTTRDAVDTLLRRGSRRYLIVDTAGMRRPSRVERGVERISVGRSMEALERADVVLLLIEAEEGLTDQDARIARRAWSEGRALVIAMNKIDLLGRRPPFRAIEEEIRRRYPTLGNAHLAFISVSRAHGIDECFKAVDRAHAAHNREIGTVALNRIIAAAVQRREPPVLGSGRLKILYATQSSLRPPTLTLYVNRRDVPTSYRRFIERCIREEVDFESTPLRLKFVRRDSHSGRRA